MHEQTDFELSKVHNTSQMYFVDNAENGASKAAPFTSRGRWCSRQAARPAARLSQKNAERDRRVVVRAADGPPQHRLPSSAQCHRSSLSLKMHLRLHVDTSGMSKRNILCFKTIN